MARSVRLRDLLVGVEGLALLRRLYEGSDAAAEQRIDEIRRLIDDEALTAGELTQEADPRTGYGAWASIYDEPGNPIVALEQPAVWSRLEPLPPGRALDAACGTGRHTQRLVELGHDVVAVDITREMLHRARARAPEARFEEADLRAIPARDGTFDLVVCGLALAHLADLTDAIWELSRVLRPGGRLLASVLHPLQCHLGWHAHFADGEGRRGFVREHAHTHADYLAAFRSGDLEVVDCVESALTAEHITAKRRVFRHAPEAALQAYVGLPGVLVWDARKRSASPPR